MEHICIFANISYCILSFSPYSFCCLIFESNFGLLYFSCVISSCHSIIVFPTLLSIPCIFLLNFPAFSFFLFCLYQPANFFACRYFSFFVPMFFILFRFGDLPFFFSFCSLWSFSSLSSSSSSRLLPQVRHCCPGTLCWPGALPAAPGLWPVLGASHPLHCHWSVHTYLFVWFYSNGVLIRT